MGSAPDSSDGPGFAGPVRAPVKGTASIRITVRAAFMAAAALVLTVALFSVVIVPAIDRGGVGELVGVVLVFLGILVAERWMRSR